ncbi:MAG: DUF1054 family protein [Alkalibacterium sp.]|nr:DUF1054 family protein [Alkalibacterium sp.]
MIEHYFKQEDFTIFTVEGLEERMALIREKNSTSLSVSG